MRNVFVHDVKYAWSLSCCYYDRNMMDVPVLAVHRGRKQLKNHSPGRSITPVINFIADDVEICRK